ncbi:MAG: Nif3-like dinuclear metal center hexameric protein [Neisseriales bacterium]|nr:MAG: Nif3-like dinuclear metal center hexameric protein [Neisseriales bacterium]
MQRRKLIALLNNKLTPWQFQDSAPNGLQIEGTSTVNQLLTAVTASQAVIEEAIKIQANTLLVHHGYFWKSESPVITGVKKQRIQMLLANQINLIAYHLPLDAHLELGNNAMLAKKLGWQVKGQFGEQQLLWHGSTQPVQATDFVNTIGQTLNRAPTVLGNLARTIQHIAWCTGAAQYDFSEAIALGVDAFVTGEVSEPNYHLAQESGVLFVAAGHHATECYGIRALGDWLSQQTSLLVQHSQQLNPI